jgi:hypothetical protein
MGVSLGFGILFEGFWRDFGLNGNGFDKVFGEFEVVDREWVAIGYTFIEV